MTPNIPALSIYPRPLSRLAFLLLWLAPAAAPAQSDTLVRPLPELSATVPDSIITLKEVRRNPRNALLWSAIPGGGQVYNKKWWKVPLVYSGLLGTIAVADFNQTLYNRITTALENRCYGDGDVAQIPQLECVPTPDEFDPVRNPDESLFRARRAADKNRQTAFIGIFLVYLLQGVEAYTDAHLQEFDISDDLSVRLGPIAQPDGMMAAGVTVQLGKARTAPVPAVFFSR